MIDLHATDLILKWGLKRSFIEYVTDVQGEIVIEPPASRAEDGSFLFPINTIETNGGATVLGFDGTARITAHGGLLSIPLMTPRLEISGAEGSLFVFRDNGTSVRMAELRYSDPTDEDHSEGRWMATLATEGTSLFGGSYFSGTPLDPIRLERGWGQLEA